MTDGTYNRSTMEPVTFSDGYQFTFSLEGETYTDDDIKNKIAEVFDFTDGNTYLGVYGGVAEISFHTKNKAVAEMYAIANNQISVWDWATMSEIETYGTGKAA